MLLPLVFFLLFVPNFQTKSMTRRGRSKIGSKTAWAMCTLSHNTLTQRLLSKAERDLERAAELDPTAPRLGFERARLAQLDGVPEEAAAVLEEYRPSP